MAKYLTMTSGLKCQSCQEMLLLHVRECHCKACGKDLPASERWHAGGRKLGHSLEADPSRGSRIYATFLSSLSLLDQSTELRGLLCHTALLQGCVCTTVPKQRRQPDMAYPKAKEPIGHGLSQGNGAS